MLSETAKHLHLRLYRQQLVLSVTFHDSTIRKRGSRDGLLKRVARKKLHFTGCKGLLWKVTSEHTTRLL